MNPIDINDAGQRHGAVYFVVGRGTEGGSQSFALSVAGVGRSQWGTVSAVAANSGYSIGTIQVDLGQRGTWPLGAIQDRPLAAGETTYVDAIIGQAAAHARAHDLPFPSDADGLAQLRSDLLSHGNGLNGRSSIRFISEEHRDTINAWARSDAGQQWIHRHIDFPQVQALADDAKAVLDQHGDNIPAERQFEVLAILAKSANQHPASYRRLVATLRDGADIDTFMDAVDERARAIPFYDGDKAGTLARQYQQNFQKPGNAIAMEAAHRQVASTDYQPAREADVPEIQTALAAWRREVNDPSVLDRGDRGEAVGVLQRALNMQDVDQDFGPATQRALTAFQRDNGLDVTGFGDAPTLAALGIGPALTDRSQTTLQHLGRTLADTGFFTDDQVARITASAGWFMLERQSTMGDITAAHLSRDGRTMAFLNDRMQMDELGVQQAERGYAPAAPLVSPHRAPEPDAPVPVR